MRAVGETLVGRHVFAIDFARRDRLGIRGWIALQFVAAAITIAGPLKAFPSTVEGEEK